MARTSGQAGWFYRQGKDWFCRTGLPSDIVVEVEGTLFHLHKFPLMSKCGTITRLVEESHNTNDETQHILIRFPGGHDAFLLAAKFCYGIRVELAPKNIIMIYCAAEYLEMTAKYDEDNLLVKAEDFFHKGVLLSWKDCILALQSSEHCLQKSEPHHILTKCFNALSMMVCTDPSLFGWPLMMYGSLQSPGGSILWNGINTGARIRSSISDWWFEDISCVGFLMFKGLMETMKVRGIRPENIAGALIYYARKYLPGLDRWQSSQGSKTRSLASFTVVSATVDQKALVEGIEPLLPLKKGKSYCRFLLGLLRIAMILNVSQPCRDSLERRIGSQLELATLDGLLIPSFGESDNLYDTDCIERIISHFLSLQGLNTESFSSSSSDHATSPSSNLSRATKLVGAYLAEVAPDVNLKPEKMHSLLEILPKSLRSLDDGLYRALDIYFKAHPWLPESEKEQLCSFLDYSKLSIDACSHASQNDRLPLRVVLQVLFFEQLHLRRELSRCLHTLELDNNNNVPPPAFNITGQAPQREDWVSVVRENRFLKVDLERLRSRVRQLEQEFVSIKQEMGKVGPPHGLINSTGVLSRKLGCVPSLQIHDRRADIIESVSPSPRKSIERKLRSVPASQRPDVIESTNLSSRKSVQWKLGCIPAPHVHDRHPDVMESTSPSPRKSVQWKHGCIPAPHVHDRHPDVIESTSPSPRKSVERPNLSRQPRRDMQR